MFKKSMVIVALIVSTKALLLFPASSYANNTYVRYQNLTSSSHEAHYSFNYDYDPLGYYWPHTDGKRRGKKTVRSWSSIGAKLPSDYHRHHSHPILGVHFPAIGRVYFNRNDSNIWQRYVRSTNNWDIGNLEVSISNNGEDTYLEVTIR